MKHKIPIILLAAFLLSSCTQVVSKIYGIKKPKPKREEILLHFLDKQGVSPNNAFALSDSSWFGLLTMTRLPGIMVFDSMGNKIDWVLAFYGTSDAKTCTADERSFLSKLDAKAEYPIDSTVKLSFITSHLFTLSGIPVSPTIIQNKSFTVILTWAYFMGGRLTRNNLPYWEETLANNGNATFNIVKVDLDPQIWWGDDFLGNMRLTGLKLDSQ